MEEFNPDSYLSTKGFNPDTYLVEKQGTETSTAGALGRGALAGIPFGLKGAAKAEELVGTGKYDDYLKELDQLVESDKAQHPVAHITGEVGGSVAPFLIPGVGEALGAETLAGRAGIGAGIGALEGASETREPLTSRSGLADIAKSAGLGAVLNPAVGALGDKVSGLLSHGAEKLEGVANEQAVKTLGMRPTVLGHMDEQGIQDLGQFAKSNNLMSGSLEERLKNAEVTKKVFGSKIGEMGEKAALVEDVSPYIQDLQEKSLAYSGSGTPEAQSMGKTYAGAVQDIEGQLPPGSSYQDVQQLKEMYGSMAFDANHQVKNQAAADAYNQLRSLQSDLVSRSPEEFKGVMKGYSQTSDIVDGIRKQLGQSRTGGGTGGMGMGIRGMIRQIPGMQNPSVALPAGAALAATGHPYVGAMAALGPLSNPANLSNAAESMASGMTGAANISKSMGPLVTNMTEHGMAPEMAHHVAVNQTQSATSEPKVPQQYIPVFQRAVQNIQDPAERQKQMTITDFVLQSRDPNYSKAKQEMGDTF